MAKIEANSKTVFRLSGSIEPRKTPVFTARVKAKKAKVRKGPGKKNDEIPGSPLHRGDIVEVYDAILSAAGNTWYFIRYKKKYGFIYAKKVQSIPEKAVTFLNHLHRYHKYVKNHGGKFRYKWENELSSFKKAKARVKKGKKAGITCLVPICWALVAMDIRRKDGKWWISGENGSFKQHYSGGIKKNLRRITKAGPVGKTVKQAVDEGLLRPGDILAFKNKTHTFAYTGDKYVMYEGGHRCMKGGRYKGLRASYKKEKRRIGEVLRWRD